MTGQESDKWYCFRMDYANSLEYASEGFDTAESCVNDFLLENHTDKNEEWWEKNIDSISTYGIEEWKGKLYNHNVHYEHNKYTELFKKYTDDLPHNISELRTYLINGGELDMFWSTRGSIGIVIAQLPPGVSYWDDKE